MLYDVLCIDKFGIGSHEWVTGVWKTDINTFMGTVERTGLIVTFWLNDDGEYVGTL